MRSLTDGNPFYSDEVVRLLVAQGKIGDAPAPGARLPLPDSVRDAIRRRLLPLEPPTMETLEVASVIGRHFRLATLQRSVGADRGAVLERLEKALDARIVTEVTEEPGTYRFAHGLIRETLYGGLGATRRARVHLAVAEALERGGAEGVLEVAHHYLEAAPIGDPAKARDYAERAGHEALRALAYEQAAELFERALRALELEDEPGVVHRGELLLARGTAEMHAGDDHARESFTAALQRARQAGDAELLSRVALAFGGFGLSPGMVDEMLVDTLEEALEALDPADSPLRARLLVRLAVAIYWSDTAERRMALVERTKIVG